MSKIRLHGSSSGYTEIAPVAASGNNTLTLPNDGTIISKDAAGAIGVTSAVIGNSGTTTIASNGDLNSTGEVGSTPSSGNTMSIRHDGTNGSINNSNGHTLLYTSDDSGDLIIHRTASNTQTFKITSAGAVQYDSGFGSMTPVYGCRAWIQLNQGGSQSITGSGGVSSISDGGTGVTTINFTTAMPDDNFAMISGGQQSSSASVNYGFSLCLQSYNTAFATIIYRPSGSSDTKEDNSKLSFAFFR